MTENQKRFRLWIEELSGGGLTTQQVWDIAKKGWDFGLEENYARLETIKTSYFGLMKSAKFMFRVNIAGAAIYLGLILFDIYKNWNT